MNIKSQNVSAGLPKAIEEHFDASSPDDVVRRSNQLMLYPQKEESESDEGTAQGAALAHPRAERVSLEAYLASALTGLGRTEKSLVIHVSDIVNLVCKEVDIELYEPRKKTDPVYNPDVPDSEVFKIDHDRVVSSDLLIHLCHFPSTGSGEELNFAYNSLVPIILISHGDQRVSRMIKGIPSLKIQIQYQDPEDLRTMLVGRLLEIRPFLEQRRFIMKKFQDNIVGQRIRELRLEQDLTRDELASRVGLTQEALAHIEDNVDTVSNPSLIHLRAIATALKTTVAEIIMPNLNDYIMSGIQTVLYEKTAARFSGMSAKDRNQLMRRYLYRVLDALDQGI
jgi:transcriptional regulator with XRE-family HTH domain